jgi:hypothetical protein
MQVESDILSLLSENGLGIPLYRRSIVRTHRWSGPLADGFLVVWIFTLPEVPCTGPFWWG